MQTVSSKVFKHYYMKLLFPKITNKIVILLHKIEMGSECQIKLCQKYHVLRSKSQKDGKYFVQMVVFKGHNVKNLTFT